MTVEAAPNPPVRRLTDWPADRLEELAEEHDTPLYVLDLDRVRQNYRRMAVAFPDADVYYAAKANTARSVLRALADEGAGVECASAGELQRAIDAGVPGERVQYTAVNPPARDLDRAVEIAADHDITITAGAEETLERLGERDFSGRVCIRVNPGVGAGHHEKVATGADAKFGVPIERVPELVESARKEFEVVGIHAHAGSGISGEDLLAHRELVARMGELARDVGGLKFVDVGGGFGVPYRQSDDPLDLEAVAEATREALRGASEAPRSDERRHRENEAVGDTSATLTVEPGRYLVADAGVLLTEVNTVKESRSATVVGVGAGMTTLARPAIYDAHHEIRNLSRTGRAQTVTVAGPVCESADTFGDHELAAPERGDLLAIGNAGAYGYEMASQYNTRPRPASVVLDGDEMRVARRRETIADVTRPEREEPR